MQKWRKGVGSADPDYWKYPLSDLCSGEPEVWVTDVITYKDNLDCVIHCTFRETVWGWENL